MSETTKVLFVCLGNIVRSPLAENMFRSLVEQAGLQDKYEADSAGTASYHAGESPDSRMQAVAAGRGLALTGKSRQFTPQDFERFDLIVPMDESNRSNILQLARSEEDQAKVRLFRQFDPQADADTAVPDPYYGGIDGFEHVFEIIERGAAGLLDALESGELD